MLIMKVNKKKYLKTIRLMGFTQDRFAKEMLKMSRQGMIDLLTRESITTNTVEKLAAALGFGDDPKDLLE